MAKVVLYNEILHRAGQDLLEKYVDVEVVNSEMPKSKLYQVLADAEGLIVRLPGKFNKELMENAPNLKVIATIGTGTNHIDIHAATERGILVVNNPGIGAIPVAEHAVALMLSLAKKVVASDKGLRKSGWDCREDFLTRNIGYELTGKTIGVIGMGFIGRKVSDICRLGFQNKIIGFDPVVSDDVFKENHITRYNDIQQLCKDADFITLHVPYNEKTHHLIGKAELNKMKPTSFLINCARGGVIDSKALYECLKDNRIAGAGIDVFESEPPTQMDKKLFQLDNIIITPHIAGITDETARELAISSAEQVLQVLNNERPKNIVNHHVLKKR